MISYKEKAAFAEENSERLTQIICAERDLEKLSKIPPEFIVMDLTWNCNYNCIACIDKEAIERKETKTLPVELIEDIFEYSKAKRVRGIMTMGGEVFLYEAGIRKALEKSIEYQIPLKTVTNGSRLGKFVPEIIKAYKIKGSQLRVSINAGKKNYQRQTGSKSSFEKIIRTISKITTAGTPVIVSTVVFPESSKSACCIPNVEALKEIVSACANSGVKTQILLPARNPITKKKYSLNREEKQVIKELKIAYSDLQIESDDVVSELNRPKQNLEYAPCPSGFLFAQIGSDGSLFKCTDNRGKTNTIIGRIKEPGDFEKFWHSPERVKAQMDSKCSNQWCVRYKVNSIIDGFRKIYESYGIDCSNYLVQKVGSNEEKIFI